MDNENSSLRVKNLLTKVSSLASGLIVSVFLFFLLILVFFYAGLALGHYIENYTSPEIAFAIVALIYLLIGIILVLLRKRLIETPIYQKLHQALFKR